MPKSVIIFFSIVLFLVIFFVVYSTYWVDRSLVNLRVALNELDKAKTPEALEKIKPLLKVSLLKEISQKTLSPKTLVYMEIAENVSCTAKDVKQVDDVKFYLKSLIKIKEKERGEFLSFLDRLNSRIIGPTITLSKKELEVKEKKLLSRVKSTQDKNLLLGLYYDLGNVYIQLSDISKAKYAFFKMLQIGPLSGLSIKAKFNLAWAYKLNQEYEKAIAYFEESR